MEIVENSKQYEYLMAIWKVGLQIVFRKAKPKMIIEEFGSFDKYIEDEDKKYAFIASLEKICYYINNDECGPDLLLYELGQYVPYIIYQDEEDETQMKFYPEDDSWLYH